MCVYILILSGGGAEKRLVAILDSIEFSIVSCKRPLQLRLEPVAVVRGEAGKCAGLMSPTRQRRVCECIGLIWVFISCAVLALSLLFRRWAGFVARVTICTPVRWTVTL